MDALLANLLSLCVVDVILRKCRIRCNNIGIIFGTTSFIFNYSGHIINLLFIHFLVNIRSLFIYEHFIYNITTISTMLSRVDIQSSCDFFSADSILRFNNICLLHLISEFDFSIIYHSVSYHLLSSRGKNFRIS